MKIKVWFAQDSNGEEFMYFKKPQKIVDKDNNVIFWLSQGIDILVHTNTAYELTGISTDNYNLVETKIEVEEAQR